ncbi:MAG: acetoacetate decarboxylase family protein [Clostridiaceae bacterium]|jgi:hypothetical protein|nr:acetoacetate decarboxylase family protein [Clostridiaceae bacterium]
MEINTLGVQPRGTCEHAIIQNMLQIEFRVSNKDAVTKLFLPKPLEPYGDGDLVYIGFVDSAFPPLREVDGEIPDPDNTEFGEVALGVPCIYKGKYNVMNSWILLDHYAGALRRGFNRSVIDKYYRTRNHPMLEGDEAIHVGSKIYAIASNDGELYAKASLKVNEIFEHEDYLDPAFFDWGQLRYVPDYANGDDIKPLVCTSTLYHFPKGMTISKVYAGDGTLEFGDMMYGLFKEFGEIKVERAYFVTFAYTYGSEDMLSDIEFK